MIPKKVPVAAVNANQARVSQEKKDRLFIGSTKIDPLPMEARF